MVPESSTKIVHVEMIAVLAELRVYRMLMRCTLDPGTSIDVVESSVQDGQGALRHHPVPEARDTFLLS